MTTEFTKEPVSSENDYVNCDSTNQTDKSNGTINEAYFRSDPDVIVRQPITSQSSLSSLYSSGGEAWAYAPSGIAPIQRSDLGSLTNIACPTYDTKSRASISTIPKDSISITAIPSGPASGSRDWSKDLFEPLRDVRKSSNKRSTLTKREF